MNVFDNIATFVSIIYVCFSVFAASGYALFSALSNGQSLFY